MMIFPLRAPWAVNQPKAKSKLWDRFVRDATGGDASLATFLQTLAGYCATGHMSEKHFAFLYGRPDTGKSTFVSALHTALGTYAQATDFETWCEENKEANPRYPLTKYMIVVDSRLGRASQESEPDLKDPTVADIAALTYKLTGVTPSARAVAKLRLSYEADEIKAALTEYASGLEDKDFKSGMRTFYTDGGATAVIYARRNRK